MDLGAAGRATERGDTRESRLFVEGATLDLGLTARGDPSDGSGVAANCGLRRGVAGAWRKLDGGSYEPGGGTPDGGGCSAQDPASFLEKRS